MARKPQSPAVTAAPTTAAPTTDARRPQPTRAAPRTIRVGNVSRSSTLLDRITFPVLEEVAAVGWAAEALSHAAKHRSGALLIAEKGSGKSIGLEQAVDEFEAGQRRHKQNDHQHVMQQLRLIPPLAAESRVELIRALYTREMGAIPAALARGGDAAIFDDLLAAWKDDNVVAVCFDEADGLSTRALSVCRDIMATSAAASGGKLVKGTRRFRATGIGVVLLGTPDLEARLKRTPEYGQRYPKVIRIDGIAGEILPMVYRQYLPAFRIEAERRGEDAWAAFIAAEIAPSVRGSIRRVEEHVRAYLTLVADNAHPAPAEIEDVGFDEQLFVTALLEMAGSEADVE